MHSRVMDPFARGRSNWRGGSVFGSEGIGRRPDGHSTVMSVGTTAATSNQNPVGFKEAQQAQTEFLLANRRGLFSCFLIFFAANEI
jgi:hypothetical protein